MKEHIETRIFVNNEIEYMIKIKRYKDIIKLVII